MAASSNAIPSTDVLSLLLSELVKDLQAYLSVFNFKANHKEPVRQLLALVDYSTPLSSLSNLLNRLNQIDTSAVNSKLDGIKQKISALLIEKFNNRSFKRNEDIVNLLDLVLTLEQSWQNKILPQISNDGLNVLRLAICYHPSVVPSLLDAINNLDKEQKTRILTSGDGGLGQLFSALGQLKQRIDYEKKVVVAKTVVPLLAAIFTLDIDNKEKVIQPYIYNIRLTLTDLPTYSEITRSVLYAINELNPTTKVKIIELLYFGPSCNSSRMKEYAFQTRITDYVEGAWKIVDEINSRGDKATNKQGSAEESTASTSSANPNFFQSRSSASTSSVIESQQPNTNEKGLK